MPERRPPPYGLLLATVSLGGVLAPLNSTMLAVALPQLRHDFGVGHGAIAWLVSAYLIAMAVAQPLGGRLGDQLGRAPVFRAGLVLFLAFSLAAAFSPSFPVLIVLRTGQALVGAAVIPNGMAMLRESVPIHRLGRSTGLVGATVSISAAVGPLLGAGLLALGSWRLLFLMNAPLVAAAFLCVAALHYAEVSRRKALALDWMGAIAFAAVLVLLTLLLGGLRGGQSGSLLIGGAVALAVFFGLFVRRQFAAASPIAEWRLFKHRSYSAATVYVLLSNLVMYTTILAVPFFIDEVQHKSSLVSGTLLGAASIPTAILAPIGGRMSDAFGRRPLVTTGGILIVIGVFVMLAGIRNDSPYIFLAACMVLLGTGLGLSVGPSNAAAIESSPRELAGSAAGTASMMRYLGSIVGAGILGAVLNSDSGAPEIGLFRIIFAVLVVMSVLGLASSLFIHRFPSDARLRASVPEVPRPVAASSEAQP